jgi:putative hemolysin
MSKTKLCLLWILFAVLVSSAYGMKNPSAVYCEALGYSFELKQNGNGDDIGVCDFPGNDGNADCDSWAFLEGKCGTDYSYCAKMGYQQKKTVGAECGSEDILAECLICILPNGTNAEVTGLMDLKVQEGQCGDGACVLGETYENCPKDCPATPTTLEEVSTIPPEETTTLPATTQPPESTTLAEETTTMPPEPSTTTLPANLCGNGVCDPAENFDSCPQDCSKPAGPADYLPYIVIIAVLLVLLFVVKKKLDEKKIAKEKAEFEKWKQEKGGTAQ